MFIFRFLALLFLIFSSTSLLANPVSPQLGQPAENQTQNPTWNLTIYPDGTGLPKGQGTALEGKHLFELHCATCHGPAGIGGSADALVGDIGSLQDQYPEKTVNSYWPYATTLFDYIRRSMPINAPYSLSTNDIYSLCAYILSQDAIIDSGVELNENTLPQVTMPNRDGFIRH